MAKSNTFPKNFRMGVYSDRVAVQAPDDYAEALNEMPGGVRAEITEEGIRITAGGGLFFEKKPNTQSGYHELIVVDKAGNAVEYCGMPYRMVACKAHLSHSNRVVTVQYAPLAHRTKLIERGPKKLKLCTLEEGHKLLVDIIQHSPSDHDAAVAIMKEIGFLYAVAKEAGAI